MGAETHTSNELKKLKLFNKELLYSNKNGVDLESLNKLISLKSQVKAFRCREGLGKQIIPENMKKVFEPITKIITDVPKDVTKSRTVTSE